MARAHWVKSSRKEHTCGKGHVISIGEGYYWAAPGFRTGRHKKYRCAKHQFRESELISGLRSEIVGAREAAEDAISTATTIDEVHAAIDEFASAADDYLSMRQEALEQWENGNSQLEEYVYQAEAIQQEVDGWENSNGYEDSDEPDADDLSSYYADAEADGEPFSRDDLVEQWRDDRLEEVRDEASDLLAGLDM
jgi:hypothetical protein